jgi:hypothetical protein
VIEKRGWKYDHGYGQPVRAKRLNPTRPEHPVREQPPRAAWVLVGLAGVLILLYGLLTLFVASAWGPGNSDEIVSGGPALITWYGLSALGTFAALATLALLVLKHLEWAFGALLLAIVSLTGWTVFLAAGPD